MIRINPFTFITKVLPVLFLILIIGGYMFLGKDPTPPENAVKISFPLKNGLYFITQNGPSGIYHQQPLEKYAMDIIKGMPSLGVFTKVNLTDFPIFGDSIYSPCVGRIKELHDGNIDNNPGSTSPTANSIVVGCDGFDVYIAHIKNGSFRVTQEQIVGVTDIIAEVGNTGNSTEPHMHILAYREDKDGSMIPLPLLLDGKYYLKNDTIH